MEAHYIINPDRPGLYYALFYCSAFLAGFILLVWEGRKRKFAPIPWLMVIATSFLFFIVGCRVIAFTESEWIRVFRLEPIPYGTARSVLGGILFSIPGILLAKKWMRFNDDMMDAFAFTLPLALAIQRFGCLLAGCCYGDPSNLPWSVQYGRTFQAFKDQVNIGVLPSSSDLSLPVHPVQVYEVILCLIIIFILLLLRRKLNAPGSLFFASTCLSGVSRFLLEFVRSSEGHVVGGKIIFGLTQVQWVIVMIVPFMLWWISSRERNFNRAGKTDSPWKLNYFRSVLYFIMMGFFFLLVSRWLDRLEILSMNIVLIPMMVLLTVYLFMSVTAPGFRVATILLPLGSLLLMNQTFPELPAGDSTRTRYTTVSFGFLGGHANLADEQFLQEGGAGGCSPGQYAVGTMKSHNNYSMGSLGIAQTIQVGKSEFISFGVNGFSGSHSESFSQSLTSSVPQNNRQASQNNHYAYSGIKPYVQYDHPDIALGFGLVAGQMRTLANTQYSNGSYPDLWKDLTATKSLSRVVPSFYVRMGKRNKFFIDYGFNNQPVAAFPVLTHQAAIGIGIGKRGSVLRVGTGSYVTLFVAPVINAGDRFSIAPYLGYGGGFNGYNTVDSFVGALNLHYKVIRKQIKK